MQDAEIVNLRAKAGKLMSQLDQVLAENKELKERLADNQKDLLNKQ